MKLLLLFYICLFSGLLQWALGKSRCGGTAMKTTALLGSEVTIGQFMNPGGYSVYFNWSVERTFEPDVFDQFGASFVEKGEPKEDCKQLPGVFGDRIKHCSNNLTITNAKLSDTGCYKRWFFYNPARNEKKLLSHSVRFNVLFELIIIRPKPVVIPIRISGSELTFVCQDTLNPKLQTFLQFSPHGKPNSVVNELGKYPTLTPLCANYPASVDVKCCTNYDKRKHICGQKAHINLDHCAANVSKPSCSRFYGNNPNSADYWFIVKGDTLEHRRERCEISRPQCEEKTFGCVDHSTTIVSELNGWDQKPNSWEYKIGFINASVLTINGTSLFPKKISKGRKFLTVHKLSHKDQGLYKSNIKNNFDLQYLKVEEHLAVNLQLIEINTENVTLKCSFNGNASVRWIVVGKDGWGGVNHWYYGQPTQKTFPLGCLDHKGAYQNLKIACSAQNNAWWGMSSFFTVGGNEKECTNDRPGIEECVRQSKCDDHNPCNDE